MPKRIALKVDVVNAIRAPVAPARLRSVIRIAARLPELDAVEVSEMSVAYSRVLPTARLADWEAEATGLPRDTECSRREQGTFVSPALHVQRYTIEPDRVVHHVEQSWNQAWTGTDVVLVLTVTKLLPEGFHDQPDQTIRGSIRKKRPI